MDEIKQRLQETSENCFKAYEKWSADKKKADARESLLESIHELRKVASRLEIELATSDRNQSVQKPIPIPPHRDAKRGRKGQDEMDDVDGNSEPEKEKVKLPPKKKAAAKKDD